jgi:hypothetical protein
VKTKTLHPTRSNFSIFHQVCNFIPQHMVPKIARTAGGTIKSAPSRLGAPVVSLRYAQLSYSVSLNEFCDSIQLHSGPLAGIRGATAPSRNGLSNARRQPPAEMAEELFRQMDKALGRTITGTVAGAEDAHSCRRHDGAGVGWPIAWTGRNTDCARAAAKTHMRLNLQSLLPNFVIIDTVGE